MKEVTVYTANPCPYCERAKALLKNRAIPYKEIMVDWNDATAWREMAARSGMRTVPQIFVGENASGATKSSRLSTVPASS